MTEKKTPAPKPTETQTPLPTDSKGHGPGPADPPGTKSDRPGVKDGSLPPGLPK